MKALKQFELEAVDRSHGVSKEVVDMTVVLTRELSEEGAQPRSGQVVSEGQGGVWGRGRGCCHISS